MNPDIAADFQTLAQIAITLTGFTGIIGAVQSRGGEALTDLQAYPIVTLLDVSALVVIAAFIPGTVALVINGEAAIWAWSYRILLVVHLLAWLIALPYMNKGGWLFRRWPQPERLIIAVATCVGISTVIAEVAVISGFFVPLAPFVYQCILITLVAIAFVCFVMLMFGFNRQPNQE